MKTLSLFFLIFAFAQNSPAEKIQEKKLVIIGDSLSEGYGVAQAAAYPSLIEKKLEADKKNWRVINASESGSTSASAPGRVQWVIKSKPDVIFLALGANDGLRGLPVEQMEKNLAKAIDAAQKAKVKVLLGGMYVPPNYSKDYAKKFRAVYEHLAKKYKIHLMPFILENVAGDPKLNQKDGLHPNEQGHKIMADNIYKFIKSEL